MKSKKLMGLLLAGSILVGATGAGSYAYFTDAVKTDANLTIAMGNLDIEIEEAAADEQWWVRGETESWDEDFAPTDSYANVRPGDTFERTVKVINAGSLKAKLDVAIADMAGIEVAPGVTFGQVFDFTSSASGEVVLEKGEELDVQLVLTVKTDLGNDLNANNGSEDLHEINIDELLADTQFITITANQVNK